MSVIVVGAGAAGLGAATVLAESDPVTIVDRIPVAGGTVRFDRSDVRAAAAQARQAGVVFLLGATATRWHECRLLVCAPGEMKWHSACSLVFAGGLRPATPAELGIGGDRPAGVLPVSVAKHLLEAASGLWQNPVILGDGPGAADAAAMIALAGGEIAYVGDGPTAPKWATSAHLGWRAAAIVGRDHVSAVRIERDGSSQLIACDAVLLAADPRPVRNVEGAIAENAEDVMYLQEIDASTFTETVRVAGSIVQRVHRPGRGSPRES